MQTDIRARFQAVSGQIQQAETDLLLEAFLMEDQKPNHRAQWELTQKAYYRSLFLRGERMLLWAQLPPQGRWGQGSVFAEDWKKTTETLKTLWYEKDPGSPEFLSDAVDFLSMGDPEARQALIRCLDLRTRLKIRQPSAVSDRVCTELLDMCAWALDDGYRQEVFTLLSNLLEASYRRNGDFPDRHRHIVIRSMFYTVDFDPALTSRIGSRNESLFTGLHTPGASRFYWFYGIALLNTEQSREAARVLDICYRLCMELEGDRSWIGARARTSCLLLRLGPDSGPETEEALWDILRKAESGYFRDTDSTLEPVAALIRSRLLNQRMTQQNMRGLLPELERLLEFCQENETDACNPLLTVRYAENLLSGYYLETGDFLQAAHHATLARDAQPPEGVMVIPSDVLICSNLLKMYTALNDTDRMIELVDHLADLWDTFEDDEYLSSEVTATIMLARNKLGIPYEDQEEMDGDLDFLLRVHQDIQDGTVEVFHNATEDIAYFQWILSMAGSLLDEAELTPEDLQRLEEIMEYFLANPGIYPLSEQKKMSAYGLLAIVHWKMKSPLAPAYTDTFLGYRESLSESNENRIIMQRFAAMIYYTYGIPDRAAEMVSTTLAGVTSAWQKAVAYLNDRKVCQLLHMIQNNFISCAALTLQLHGSQALYERVLQFKDLPALVGRERNRLLRQAPVDPVLRDEIFALQDLLASAQTREEDTQAESIRILQQLLQEKEAAFAAKFPRNLAFTPISFQAVRDKLPRGCAIAEYFLSIRADALGPDFRDTEALVIELFLTVNRNGNPDFIHLTLPRGDGILQDAEDFIQALQKPDDLALAGQKSSLQMRLFRDLIAPAMAHLTGISTLYIAPDATISNLPFEILQDDSFQMLQDRFRILRLVSGRDLLFSDDGSVPSGGALVLGDPDYDASEKGQVSPAVPEPGDDFTRSILDRSSPVAPLPCSGAEVRRIGQKLRCHPVTGKRATKYALEEALPCGLIHLATHGIFDAENESANSLYASCLVFAGFNRFLDRKEIDPVCGNGILTADEISRMNLSGTHLVVLSACQSGMGSAVYRSSQGLISAFSAAGVRWVISHMWHASDLAAAILMDAFYDAHLRQRLDVPEALAWAKEYLRTVTAGELRRQGWPEALEPGANGEMLEKIREIRTAKEKKRFFADEFYWGGFVCHKCK